MCRNSWIVLLALMAISSAHALNIADYKRAKATGGQSWELMKVYVTGVGDGEFWSSIALETQHQKPLFCAPPKLALAQQNFLDILEKAIQQHKLNDTIQIGMALQFGFRDSLPCPSPDSHAY